MMVSWRVLAVGLLFSGGVMAADYPAPVQGEGLAKIVAPMLVINSADDERNPPETGVLEQALTRVKSAQYYLIPESAETAGHGTTGMGKFYQKPLREFLAGLPEKTN